MRVGTRRLVGKRNFHPRMRIAGGSVAGAGNFHPRTPIAAQGHRAQAAVRAFTNSRYHSTEGRSPRHRDASVPQRVLDVSYGLLRMLEDAFRSHQNQAPALRFEPRTSADVGVPLRAVLGVLTSLVLDREQEGGVAEVDAEDPGPVSGAQDLVDLRLGQAGQHHQHPEPGLHDRVDARPHETGRTTSTSAARSAPGRGRIEELLWRCSAGLHERVTHGDEIDQRDAQRCELQKGADRWRDRYAGSLLRRHHRVGPVSSDAASLRASDLARRADVGLSGQRRPSTPESYGTVMADVRAGGGDQQGSTRLVPKGELDVGSQVHAVEDPAEAWSLQLAISDAGTQGGSTGERCRSCRGSCRPAWDHPASADVLSTGTMLSVPGGCCSNPVEVLSRAGRSLGRRFRASATASPTPLNSRPRMEIAQPGRPRQLNSRPWMEIAQPGPPAPARIPPVDGNCPAARATQHGRVVSR